MLKMRSISFSSAVWSKNPGPSWPSGWRVGASRLPSRVPVVSLDMPCLLGTRTLLAGALRRTAAATSTAPVASESAARGWAKGVRLSAPARRVRVPRRHGMSSETTGTREGNLEAPTRHPLGQDGPGFFDQAALEKEMERIFNICHGCRRCVSLCHAFPTLFDLIDESETMEIDGVDKA